MPAIAQVISPTGLLIRANAPIGNNSITYTLVNGACTNTTSTSISATVFRSAALTGSIPDLCYFGSPVNMMSIVANTVSGQWYGNGIQVPARTTLVPSAITNSANLAVTGYYEYIYRTTSAPNPNVCPDSSKILVHVLKPAQPSIMQPPPHCITDAPFQLNASPNTGYFTASPFVSPGGLFSPALSSVGNNQIEYTIGTSTCNIKDVKTISIEAFVPATLTGTIGEQCSSNPVMNLSSIVLNTSGTWSGPGITGSTFDPAISGTGQILVTYNTSSSPSGLCPDSRVLTIPVYSLATPVIDDIGPYCNSMQPVKLIATPLGGVFTGDNNNAVGFTGVFSPASAVIGDNIVTYSVTSGPCKAVVKAVVKVEKFVSAGFLEYAREFCRDGKPLDLNSLAQNPGGLWSGDGMTGSVFNPANANIGNSNEVTYQTTSYPTATLCPDVNKMKIVVNDLPKVMVIANKQQGCAPVEVVLNSPDAAVGGKGKWYFGDGTSFKEGLSTTYIYNIPGTYTVTFNYTDNLGCTGQAILAAPIVVHDIPKAEFTYGPFQEITISDPQVQFSNQTNVLGNNTYLWQIDSLYSLPDVNPNVTFPHVGKYEITLNATSVHGCKDKVSRIIEVKNEFNVYIPNSFTPNADGLNDVFIPVFSPYGLDAKTFEMEIFDRWGKPLYHTKDVSKGWDGSVQNKGLDQLKSDVYTYKIKYRDMEGVVFNKLGHVSVVR
jgi:gliding motility-associated-like protein